MDPMKSLAVQESKSGRDACTDVAAVRDETLVSEHRHQLCPLIRDREHVGAESIWCGREGVSGQRRNDDVEAFGLDIVWVGERLSEPEQLGKGARPTLGQDDRG